MKKVLIASLFMLFFFASCKEKNNTNTYAIRDFREPLRPYLTKLVSRGIVGGFDSPADYVETHATDEELKQLSDSEHPVLRAVAFRAMMKRPSIDHFQLIMNNLDDAAMVATDAGEWGTWYVRVTDDLLQNGKWKDTIARNQTVERVILKHNYLRCAFTALRDLEPLDKYYEAIKNMALRRRTLFDQMGGLAHEEREYALFALASYKKPEDIDTIKNILTEELGVMTDRSFRLMREFPHEVYFNVFADYYSGHFYRQICHDQNINNAGSFMTAVASYKNERSAAILGEILNRKPFLSCDAKTYFIKYSLAYAIWDNPCAAYSKLRTQVEGLIKKYESQLEELPPVGPIKILTDKPDPEPIRWLD